METLFTQDFDDRFTMRVIFAPTSSSPVRLRLEYSDGQMSDRSADLPIDLVKELMRHGVVAAHVASLMSCVASEESDGSEHALPLSDALSSAFSTGFAVSPK